MQLSRREKWLLTVPVFLGGAILFYNYVHAPLFARKHTAASQLQTVTVDLSRSQSKLKREGDLTARQSAVSNREKVVDVWVPGKNSAAMFIWYLGQAELNSGARVRDIKLSDRKDVNPADSRNPKAGSPPASTQQQPAPATAQPASSGTTPDASTATPIPSAQQSSPGAPSTAKVGQANADINPSANITVIGIDLKVDARFVEHMLFSQALEQWPLFLSVDALDMSLSNQSPTDKVTELLKKGDQAGAERLLSASPIVTATYHINLYFKGPRPGPAVSNTMQFANGTGKVDPFARSDVSEFIQELQDYMKQQQATTPQSAGGSNDPATQQDQPKQLG